MYAECLLKYTYGQNKQNICVPGPSYIIKPVLNVIIYKIGRLKGISDCIYIIGNRKTMSIKQT